MDDNVITSIQVQAIAPWEFSAYWRYLGITGHSHLFTSTRDFHLIGRQTNRKVYLNWPQVMAKADSCHRAKPYPTHISDSATLARPNQFTSTLHSLLESADFPTQPRDRSVMATPLMRYTNHGRNLARFREHVISGQTHLKSRFHCYRAMASSKYPPLNPFSDEIWIQ